MRNRMKRLKTLAMLFAAVLPLVFTACSGSLETTAYESLGEFVNINIATDTADVVFLPTSGECRVVCQEKRSVKHSVTVMDGELRIELVDTRAFYEKLFNFGQDKITVYLPEGEYGVFSVRTDTGDVSLTDITSVDRTTVDTDTGDVCLTGITAAEKISIETDTGDVEIENCETNGLVVITDTGDVDLYENACETLDVKVATGDVSMTKVIATGEWDVVSDTGDVEFDRCDGAEIVITTDTGDVEGSFLSDKVIFAQTDTGKVSIPKHTSGGRCEITTDTGDIRITINQN